MKNLEVLYDNKRRLLEAIILQKHAVKRPISFCDEVNRPDVQRNVTPRYCARMYSDLKEVFNHYCAGSNSLKKDIFNRAYVTPNNNVKMEKITKSKFDSYISDSNKFQQDLEYMREVYVNASLETINIFSQYLCYIAHLPKQGNVRDNDSKKVLFLTGDYGQGKTFLINYILTANQDLFENNNIITIKVDLANFHKAMGTIEEKMQRKTIKILKSKYFIGKIFGEEPRIFERDLKNYLLRTEQENHKYILTELFRVDSDKTVKLSGDKLSNTFRILKNFISYSKENTKKKYKFLFIIDGLDNFTRDIRSAKHFNLRVNELEKFIIKKEDKDDGFLIVTRNEAYLEILNRCNRGTGSSLVDMKRTSLFPVDYNEVLKKKISVFGQFLDLSMHNEDIESESYTKNLFKNNLKTFFQFLIDFTKKTLTDEKSNSVNIDNFFNNNMRDVITFYKIVARTFLYSIPFTVIEQMDDKETVVPHQKLMTLLKNENKHYRDSYIKKYHYLIYNGIMVNEFYFTIDPYGYSFDQNTGFYHSERKPYYEQCSLIPNLFQYDQKMVENLDDQQTMPYLIKIRALQLIKYFEDNNKIITFDALSKYLEKWFGFDYNSVFGSCHMLYTEQCVNRDTMDPDRFRIIRKGKSYGRFRLTDRGRFMINSMLFKYEYLSNLIDNIFIEQDYCTYFFKPCKSIVFLYEMMTETDNKEELSKYSYEIGEQILIRAIKIRHFIDFLETIEKNQIERFKECTGKKNILALVMF